jgi:16S rRNA (adenine1518-N6/adenine1519-N6)-dimethyltransferase
MGQNFLVEPDVVREIADAAAVKQGDRIVEVGPGLGILSQELLARGCRVTGVELDDELAAFLERDLHDHPGFDLVRKDARHVDVEAVTGGEPYSVVANLPYSVATVIIRHFIESGNPPNQLTVMVQREVAERMVANPPGMSLLGLATQFHTEAALDFIVQPGAFQPPPKVESAVLTLRVKQHLDLSPELRNRMFALATLAFQRKRKTIANGLSQGLDLPKNEVESRLNAAGIDPQLRPQNLDVGAWIATTHAFRGDA